MYLKALWFQSCIQNPVTHIRWSSFEKIAVNYFTKKLHCSTGFLYDNGLRHERVKCINEFNTQVVGFATALQLL